MDTFSGVANIPAPEAFYEMLVELGAMWRPDGGWVLATTSLTCDGEIVWAAIDPDNKRAFPILFDARGLREIAARALKCADELAYGQEVQ